MTIHKVGIIMNGVTGRMGTNQHLLRSIAEIIKQGYGFAYLGFPFSKSDDFRRYQSEAMQANKGLWGSCTPTKNDYGGYTSNDAGSNQ